MAKEANIARAKNQLSTLVNMVAHGRERIILTSRGRPKAALIGLEDLAALEDLPTPTAPDDSWLSDADLLVERIRRRRRGVLMTDSVDDLTAIREGER